MFESSPDYSYSMAHKKFQEINNKTSYGRSFGEPPKAEEDFVVLKTKPFKTLNISQYIQP
jgi:hypothetical protein